MFKIGIINYASAVPPNGLLNNLETYYKADTNGSFPDAHGSNDGTINGATYTASGKINGGYDFDGVNDIITLPNVDGKTDFGTNDPFTISFWVKIPTNQVDTVSIANDFITSPQKEGKHSYNIGMYNQTDIVARKNKIFFQRYDGSNLPRVISTNTYNDNSWHLITVTSDNTNLKLYIDGTFDLSVTDTVTGAVLTTGLCGIGAAADAGLDKRHFIGAIDEVGMWSTALDSTKISSLYNSGAGLSYNNFTT